LRRTLRTGGISETVGLALAVSVEQVDYGTTEGVALDASFEAVVLAGDLEGKIGLSGEADAEAEYNQGVSVSVEIPVTMEGVSLTDTIPEVIGVGEAVSRGHERLPGKSKT